MNLKDTFKKQGGMKLLLKRLSIHIKKKKKLINCFQVKMWILPNILEILWGHIELVKWFLKSGMEKGQNISLKILSLTDLINTTNI